MSVMSPCHVLTYFSFRIQRTHFSIAILQKQLLFIFLSAAVDCSHSHEILQMSVNIHTRCFSEDATCTEDLFLITYRNSRL
jgi:hypothetical protein